MREFVRHVSQLKACFPRAPDTAIATTSSVHQVANDVKPMTPRKCEPVLREVLPKLTLRLQDIFAAGKYQRSNHAKSTEPRKNPRNNTCESPDPSADTEPSAMFPDDREELWTPKLKMTTAARPTTKSVADLRTTKSIAEPKTTKSVASQNRQRHRNNYPVK